MPLYQVIKVFIVLGSVAEFKFRLRRIKKGISGYLKEAGYFKLS